MKKLSILVLLGILSLSLLTGAMAETAAPAPETAVTAAVQTAPALDAAELDALLALKLESGKTFSAVLEELGVLDAFKAAQPREQIGMIYAQLLLGKLTRADVTLLQQTLAKSFLGDDAAAGPMAGWGRFNRGGRDERRPGKRGGMMDGRNGMMGGWNGMMQPGQGRGQAQGGAVCPNCPNCPLAATTPETVPEATVAP